MSIRVKLILTYLGMLFLSVILVLAIGMTAISAGIGEFVERALNGKSFEVVFKDSLDLMVDLRYTEKNDPDRLKDTAFMEKIASDLKPFKGFLVVESAGEFKTFGGVQQAGPEMYQTLKMVAAPIADREKYEHYQYTDHVLQWNNQSYWIIDYDFPDVTGDMTYYLAIDVSHIKTTGNHLGYGFLMGFLIFTGIIVAPIFWITSKDIIKPLKQLERGSERIAEGDLNFKLKNENYNEIGRVIYSFEKMRRELKKSIDSRLEVEQNRKELIASMSHDLKTPITAIKGYVEGIRDGVADSPEKLDRYLETIYSKSLDLDRMIEDLFLFSKLDLKNEIFEKQVIGVHDFCESCMAELHMQYDQQGIQLTESCALDKGAKVLMDSQKVKRVILNVVNNAVKYMDKTEKKLNFEFMQTDTEFVVRITDNGMGISKENLTRIFERFYTVDPSRNQDVGGTGLGLAIAREIIEQHGGSIKANSEKDVFTTIEFSLPLMPSEEVLPEQV